MTDQNSNGREFENIPIVTPEVVERMSGGVNGVGDIVASGRTIEQIRSKYHTAVRVQVARDLDSVKKRCLQEAKHGGDEFGWAWPVEIPVKDERGQIKKDANGRWITKEEIIDGKSVHLAMAAARNWGNCTTELYVTADLPDRCELMGVFVDFETGYTNMRPYTIRKASRELSEKQKKKASQIARQEDMTMQIGLSKCIRNVVLGALPSWLTDSMYEESKKYAKSRVEANLKESIERAVALFAKWDVNLDRLEIFLDKPRSNDPKTDWNADDVLKLRAAYQAIKDGDMTISEAFPAVPGAPMAKPTATQTTAPETRTPPPQPTQPAEPPHPAAPPTQTAAQPHDPDGSLTEEQGAMLDEINARAGLISADPKIQRDTIFLWSGQTCRGTLELRNKPNYIIPTLDAARADCEARGLQLAGQGPKKGKLL
ncbi:hypothetical protein KKH18_06850 [bacterium]|nr:hypothetical protein [bacterium]